MKLIEILAIAFDSIRINISRTIITCLIIAIGIMALVGILTSIDAMEQSLKESFSDMGSNSFSIKNRVGNVRMGGGPRRKKTVYYPNITYNEAVDFKQQFQLPATISNSIFVTGGATVKSAYESSNPNKQVLGVDEDYFNVSGNKIEYGRLFSSSEVENNRPVAIIGADIVKEIFKNSNPMNKIINVGNMRLEVIGVLEEKGSSFGGGEGQVYVPITYARTKTSSLGSYTITVQVSDAMLVNSAIETTTGTFRKIRGLGVKEENNFEISTSDALAKEFLQNLSFITIAASVIGFITILGSAIGLLNIMLVTVTERTREIGVRKSLGATPKIIQRQFLVEAILICLLGGLAGIILGILLGNVISAQLGAGLIIPWNWMIMAFILCTLVGLLAGYYPARKAARLDPIEALRNE